MHATSVTPATVSVYLVASTSTSAKRTTADVTPTQASVFVLTPTDPASAVVPLVTAVTALAMPVASTLMNAPRTMEAATHVSTYTFYCRISTARAHTKSKTASALFTPELVPTLTYLKKKKLLINRVKKKHCVKKIINYISHRKIHL